MLDFADVLNLPLIWGILIATAVFLYVLLDGFDLGCGILFPFAPSHECRSRMMNSIAPFWDGNETWLVLGGGGLFAAFPVAYAILMPAVYIPVIIMLLGLILRGVAFEFRFKAGEGDRRIWDTCFHFGSLTAAFMQGMILGTMVMGIEVEGRSYAGGPLDWAHGFAVMCGVAMVFGYALLGATWLIYKTDGKTQDWARDVARYVLIWVGIAMAIVSLSMPISDPRIYALWFSTPNLYLLAPVPLITLGVFILIWRDIGAAEAEVRPFLCSIGVFLLGYIGLGISLYPWIVPFAFTLEEAAAASTSQSILLIGTVILLPIILCYTAYSYYVFRGKSSHESLY